MPNVNYRGKLLSKDPDLMTEEELSAAFEAMPLPARQEAMKRALDEEMGPVAVMSPTSGVTSIPLVLSWPPLSREQVVKLHEGLVAFRGEMEASKGIRSHEDQQDMIWGAAVELDGLLVEMGIGSPPPKQTWTHEEIAKVAEEVQNRVGLPRHTEGRAPTTATELAITAAMEDRFGHITDLSRHSKPREEPTTDEDSGPGAMSWQRAEEFGSPFATQQPVETAKRECWTCRSFHINNGCGKKGTASAALAAHLKKMDDMIDGGASTTEVASMDLNCPGWERKP